MASDGVWCSAPCAHVPLRMLAGEVLCLLCMSMLLLHVSAKLRPCYCAVDTIVQHTRYITPIATCTHARTHAHCGVPES